MMAEDRSVLHGKIRDLDGDFVRLKVGEDVFDIRQSRGGRKGIEVSTPSFKVLSIRPIASNVIDVSLEEST